MKVHGHTYGGKCKYVEWIYFIFIFYESHYDETYEEVDHEGGLICDLNEILKLRRENMLLKDKLSQILGEKEWIIVSQNIQVEKVEETKRIE